MEIFYITAPLLIYNNRFTGKAQSIVDNDVFTLYNKVTHVNFLRNFLFYIGRKAANVLNNRIRKLRKYLDLTQQEFAGKIGSSQNILANYETGRRNPSNSVINNICKTFNVNEEWLRNGEGEMFLPEAGKELEALAKKYNLSHSAQIVIEKFVKMNESERQILLNYYTEIANALSASHYLENAKAFPNNDLQKP